METENEIKQYIKLLIKEFESEVLADERYRTGILDAGFIHNEFNVAVGKYLKNVTATEAAGITDNQRLYYRGWIAAYLAIMLNLDRQERHEKEIAQWHKQQGKLEKELQRRDAKIEKLETKLAAMAEKAKKKS